MYLPIMLKKKITVPKRSMLSWQYLVRVLLSRSHLIFVFLVSSMLGKKDLNFKCPKVKIMPFFAIFPVFPRYCIYGPIQEHIQFKNKHIM